MSAQARAIRIAAENGFALRTESVSMMNSRYSAQYPDAEQIAIVLADAELAPEFRERDEENLLDLLTTPGCPVVEIDRTPTRVFLAIV
ncbi:MAG TPA: hypothetical protein PLB92_00295 [Rhodoglobus sp.]|nr:hypothetical protein [Rhodoglobus sp.]